MGESVQSRIHTACDVDSDALRSCLNESFADYIVPSPSIAPQDWSGFLQRQGCDPALSLVCVDGNRVASFALVTPRKQDRWRVAVMGARPEARGRGFAASLLDRIISDARLRNLRSIELEVFAQNERALRLYRTHGFLPSCALYGFEADAGAENSPCGAQEIIADDACDWAENFENSSPSDLPWQVCADAIRRSPSRPMCWRHEGAQLVCSDASDRISVVSLMDRDPGYADARRLLCDLRARFPKTNLRAPQLQAAHGPALAFKAAGWKQLELYQFLMKLTLAG